MSNFFGKLKKNIDKGILTVSEKSSLLVETAKIRGQIAKLEEQNNMLLLELGANVYLAYGNEPLDEEFMAEKVAEIAEVEAALNEKLAELQALNEADKAEPMPEVEVEAVTCECGAELQPDSKFCMNCGKRLED